MILYMSNSQSYNPNHTYHIITVFY